MITFSSFVINVYLKDIPAPSWKHPNFLAASPCGPHGEAAEKFGCFHDGAGISLRYTFITNEENVITEIIKSDEIGVERDFSEYSESFGI